jgi:recombination protein RecA
MAMNVEKEKAIELALQAVERQFGKGSIMRLGNDEPMAKDVSAIPTGSVSLDIALGVGGVPRGRIVEIFGPESSGKTTLSLHIVAEAQKRGGVCGYIDAEHAMDVGYARKLGVRTDDLLLSQPDTGEQGLEIAEMLVRSGAIDCHRGRLGRGPGAQGRARRRNGRRAHGRAGPPDEPGAAQADRRGGQEPDVPHLHQPNSHEDRRDVRQPRDDHRRQRAEVLRLAALDIRRIGAIKNGENVVGSRTRVKVVKNKVAPPFKEAEFDIMYGVGISKEGDLVDLASENGIVEKSGSWFSFKGERIGQGRENAKDYLRDHPEVLRDIEAQVLEKFGVKASAPLTAVPPLEPEQADEKRPRVKAVK